MLKEENIRNSSISWFAEEFPHGRITPIQILSDFT